MENTLLVLKTMPSAKIPTRATVDSAGYDIYSAQDVFIQPRNFELVATGIILILPVNTYGRLASRSGLAVNNQIEVGAGVIDRDFRGAIKVLLRNYSDDGYQVEKGDRITQLIIEMHKTPEVMEIGGSANEPGSSNVRGSDGFGSSGK